MGISGLNHTPRAAAVYASWPSLPQAHATLASRPARYALPGLDFHQPIAPASWRLPFAHPTGYFARNDSGWGLLRFARNDPRRRRGSIDRPPGLGAVERERRNLNVEPLAVRRHHAIGSDRSEERRVGKE